MMTLKEFGENLKNLNEAYEQLRKNISRKSERQLRLPVLSGWCWTSSKKDILQFRKIFTEETESLMIIATTGKAVI